MEETKLREFVTHSADGTRYLLCEYQEYSEIEVFNETIGRHERKHVEGLRRLETSTGEPVHRLAKVATKSLPWVA